MRFHDPATGETLLSHDEEHTARRAAEVRADSAEVRADSAEARADAAEARIAELESRLGEKGR